MKGITRRRDLDPWARAWCFCQVADRRHAHVPGGLALLFPDRGDRDHARAARRWALAAIAAAALGVGWAVFAIIIITGLR